MVGEERFNELESRVSRLEGVVEQINLRLGELRSRMDSIEARMNFQIGLTFAVWASVTGILLAILLTG